MNLNDESISLLSSELYKYPDLEEINIRKNKNVHSVGLKALLPKFNIDIQFDFNESKELLIDEDFPDFIEYLVDDRYGLNNSNSDIDDKFFKSFISLRLEELEIIEILDLSNNNLTSESIELLINNLSSLPDLKHLDLYGNPIGDSGMKILSPHADLLKDGNRINCSKMGLSSKGLKHLLKGVERINYLDISNNSIGSKGIEYLMKYIKKGNNISQLVVYNNPIGSNGFKLLSNNLLKLLTEYRKLNLNNISIDDDGVMIFTEEMSQIERMLDSLNLDGNNIKMSGLKSICEKTLEGFKYPFVQMKNINWTSEELEYYLIYCINKKRVGTNRYYDFSSMNLNDSHIPLIKMIDCYKLDLSNNKISSKGLKELSDNISKTIYNNPIGDEGIEIVCKNIDEFVYDNSSLNLSNIGMSGKGLKMLIERLKDYDSLLRNIDISGNELNEEELRLMKENEEVFDYLEELSITVTENINKNELKSFLEIFSSIGIIKLNGLNEKEMNELSKQFVNIEQLYL